MAGENKAQGAVSFTPIVKIAAGSDADADAIDVIHHNIKQSLGGDLTFTTQDGDDNWFYAPNVICTTTSDELFGASDDVTDLVGASGDQTNGPNEAIGSALTFTDDSTADCSADKVWFLFVKNTSTGDGVYIVFDGGTAAYNVADGIFIGPSQTWFGRLPNTTVANIHAISSDIGDTGDGTANLIVAALIDDVA